MGLVDDQRVVAAQVPVPGELVQQDAVGHQLDQRAVGGHVGEPDLVADRLPQRAAQLLGDPFGDGAGGQPPRLGVSDLPVDPAAELQADLGYLGRLARAGLPRDHHHLVVADGCGDVVPALADGQLGGIRDRRHGRAPGGPRGRPRGRALSMRPGSPGTPGPQPGGPGGRRRHSTRLHTGGKNRSGGPLTHNSFPGRSLPPAAAHPEPPPLLGVPPRPASRSAGAAGLGSRSAGAAGLGIPSTPGLRPGSQLRHMFLQPL